MLIQIHIIVYTRSIFFKFFLTTLLPTTSLYMYTFEKLRGKARKKNDFTSSQTESAGSMELIIPYSNYVSMHNVISNNVLSSCGVWPLNKLSKAHNWRIKWSEIDSNGLEFLITISLFFNAYTFYYYALLDGNKSTLLWEDYPSPRMRNASYTGRFQRNRILCNAR